MSVENVVKQLMPTNKDEQKIDAVPKALLDKLEELQIKVNQHGAELQCVADRLENRRPSSPEFHHLDSPDFENLEGAVGFSKPGLPSTSGDDGKSCIGISSPSASGGITTVEEGAKIPRHPGNILLSLGSLVFILNLCY